MAEGQANHRMTLEAKALGTNASAQTRGQYLACTVALAAFGLSGFLVTQDAEFVAGIIAVLDIGSLVGLFLYGRRSQDEQRKAHR